MQLKSSIIGVLSQINSSISNDTYGDAADDILDFETEMSKVCRKYLPYTTNNHHPKTSFMTLI